MPKARALIVEDDRSWQQILTEILSDAGLEVDCAGDLPTAMNCMKQFSHRLAIVDLSLSPEDHRDQQGLEALQMLRRVDPSCQVMMLTGYATVELAVSVLTEYGALTCLRKETFRRSQFREQIRQALSNAPWQPPADEAKPADPLPQAKTIAEPPLREMNALVVEDDAGWRSILMELLSDAGFTVRLCSGYGEAFGALRHEKFDLAVFDLSLDRENQTVSSRTNSIEDLEGFRLLACARAANIPTLVVSGINRPEEINRAYTEHGVFAYIEKQNFDRRSFMRAVQDAIKTATQNPSAHPAAPLEVLTEREREVLDLIAQGLTNKEIADRLVISTNTVKRHLKSIFAKLEIHTRSAAAAAAASTQPDKGVSL